MFLYFSLFRILIFDWNNGYPLAPLAFDLDAERGKPSNQLATIASDLRIFGSIDLLV